MIDLEYVRQIPECCLLLPDASQQSHSTVAGQAGDTSLLPAFAPLEGRQCQGLQAPQEEVEAGGVQAHLRFLICCSLKIRCRKCYQGGRVCKVWFRFDAARPHCEHTGHSVRHKPFEFLIVQMG